MLNSGTEMEPTLFDVDKSEYSMSCEPWMFMCPLYAQTYLSAFIKKKGLDQHEQQWHKTYGQQYIFQIEE